MTVNIHNLLMMMEIVYKLKRVIFHLEYKVQGKSTLVARYESSSQLFVLITATLPAGAALGGGSSDKR